MNTSLASILAEPSASSGSRNGVAIFTSFSRVACFAIATTLALMGTKTAAIADTSRLWLDACTSSYKSKDEFYGVFKAAGFSPLKEEDLPFAISLFADFHTITSLVVDDLTNGSRLTFTNPEAWAPTPQDYQKMYKNRGKPTSNALTPVALKVHRKTAAGQFDAAGDIFYNGEIIILAFGGEFNTKCDIIFTSPAPTWLKSRVLNHPDTNSKQYSNFFNEKRLSLKDKSNGSQRFTSFVFNDFMQSTFEKLRGESPEFLQTLTVESRRI
ncbi:hypothetical protein [Roseovarius phycicola]|uniref:Uncharacterized protein n=1 Tax=Roseovarius phycicola TaxID=3080976 RepID=A0ABZ2HGV7_9RHOB